MPIISLENVSFSYHHESVLEDINLTVEKGDFLGLVGPNGSGKSTLLKILLGLLKPTSGNVKLFGQDLSEFKNWSKVGYVPQRLSMGSNRFPITVEEVVNLGRLSHKPGLDFFSRRDKAIVTKALQEVDMAKHAKAVLHELSGGQQQRVFIARALASEPELLILDEPTVGVDVNSQAAFYDLLGSLNQQLKLTLVLVSHDIDVIAHEVSEVACLNRRLIGHGKPKDMLKNDVIKELYGQNARLVVHQH